MPELTVTSSESILNALMHRRRRSLALSLSSEEKQEIISCILRDFTDARASWKEFMERHQVYIKNWRGTVDPVENGPLGDLSANIRTPLSSTFTEQWKAKIVEAIIGDELIGQFESMDESIPAQTINDLTDWFRWVLLNDVKIDEVIEEIAHNVLLDGIALPMPKYEREFRTMWLTREFEHQIDVPIEIQLETALQQIFSGEGIQHIETTDFGVYEVFLKGFETPAVVKFILEGENLIAEIEREEKIFDGVRITTPNIEDVIVLDNHNTIEGLPFYGTRFFLHIDEFLAKTKKGQLFEKLDKETIELLTSAALPKRGSFIPRPITDEVDLDTGVNSQSYGTTARWIEIYRWESVITYKGERINIVAWLANATNTLLQVLRLEELNKDGLRSPTKFEFIPQYGRFYGIGLMEWLQHVQTEMDGIHNHRLNSGLVANFPFFFFEPGAGIKETVLQLKPGQGLPVKSISKILFPNINWSSIWGFQEEALVRKSASEQAGLGDPGAGTFTSKRVSASEFQGTALSIELRAKLIIRRFMRSLDRLLTRVFGLYQQYASDELIYQVSTLEGLNEVRKIRSDVLHGRVRLRLTGTTQRLNAQLERDLSLNIFTILQNGILMQMGIVKPDTVVAALKKIMRAFNVKDIPIHAPDIEPDSPPPDTEHKAMLRGEAVEPHIGENFAYHIQSHLRLMSDPQFAQMVPDPQRQMLFQQHLMSSVQMYQQIQQIRQMQAAQALETQKSMARMGVQPGVVGNNQAGEGAEPATQDEITMPQGGGQIQ
jgi:hypothetical protein